MKRLSGKKQERFEEALLSAFPSQTTLERFVKFDFNLQLSQITSGGSYTETVFQLINWAETNGQLDELIEKAHKRVPGNILLEKFFATYFKNRIRSIAPISKSPRKLVATVEKKLEIGTQPLTTNRLTKRVVGTIGTKKLSGRPKNSETDWLNHFEFERSPFERLEAGSQEFADPGFLSECFVEPDCFFDILGQANAPTTTILYARRGEGKTACRVMIDYLCQHDSVPDMKTGQTASVLSVPHIRMREIAQHPSLENHVIEILRRAMPQFVELVMNSPNIRNQISSSPRSILLDLSWFIDFYSSYLTYQQTQVLSQIGLQYPIDSSPNPLFDRRKAASSIDHLEQFCKLVHNSGIKAVYILLDGLDENDTTAKAPEESYRLLAPLFTNRDLIDKIPYLAIKGFIPSNLEELILSDISGRPELIPSYHIEWSPEKLILLLRRRILYFKKDKISLENPPGLEEFCVPDLYGKIENELLRIAGDNPRNILKFCDLLIETHCQSDIKLLDDPYKLTPEDIVAAQEKFNDWYKSNTIRWGEISSNLEESRIRQMIERGESERVEFKSTLIRDLKTNLPNDNLNLPIVIAKEIVGMINSAGGSLLLGVGDDKNLIGIEGDFEFLGTRNKNRPDSKKQDIDGFQLKLIDLIKDNLGKHVLDNIKYNFVTLDNHIVCEIVIRPFFQPVYFGKSEEFFIRKGTSNLKLNPSEIFPYIKEHWHV